MSRRDEQLNDLVQTVFSEGKNSEHVENYLGILRENWRECNSVVSRYSTLILVFAAVFELLSRAQIEKAALGPFEIKDFAPIRLGLPVIIAYMFFYMEAADNRRGIISSVYYSISRVARTDFATAGLAELGAPFSTGFLASAFTLRRLYGKRHRKLLNILSYSLTGVIRIGLFLFEIYSFVILFRQFGFGNIAVWIGLFISLFFLLYAIAVYTE